MKPTPCQINGHAWEPQPGTPPNHRMFRCGRCPATCTRGEDGTIDLFCSGDYLPRQHPAQPSRVTK